jgi:hypothetical protein
VVVGDGFGSHIAILINGVRSPQKRGNHPPAFLAQVVASDGASKFGVEREAKAATSPAEERHVSQQRRSGR